MDTRQQKIGRFAWVMAWVGLVAGQLHALARFATADGKKDLELPLTAAWAEPAAELLSPLLTWANPEIVYITYGKIWFPVFVAFTLAAFLVYRRRQPGRFETWVWRVVLGVYVALCVGVFITYWTQWTGDYNSDGIEALLFTAGFMVSFPALFLSVILSTVLGVTLLAKRFRPLTPAALMALVLPIAAVVSQVTSLGSVLLPVMLAFGILGRRIAKAETPERSRDAFAV